MIRILLLVLSCIFLSCGNEKTVQLPEIDHAEITEIQDVSAAYLFFDETQTDSVLLNRKNLISTTNWLVNVDKRLTLRQVIPHIRFLQDKKKNASHKNENAKNYFTCHDTSRNNLGFMEFTDINYLTDLTSLFIKENPKKPKWEILTHIVKPDSIRIYFAKKASDDIASVLISSQQSLTTDLYNVIRNDSIHDMQNRITELFLGFYPDLTFQDYISIKSALLSNVLDSLEISKNEYIYF